MNTAVKEIAGANLTVRMITALGCVLTLAGCAGQDDLGSDTRVAGETTSTGTGSQPSETTPTSGGTATTPPDTTAGKKATSVTIRITGGLRGDDQRRVYAEGAPPPPRHTRADIAQMLEAASAPELIAVKLTKVPPQSCCDKQTYVVTVRYDDASQRTYTSLDGLEQPRVFEKFLGML